MAEVLDDLDPLPRPAFYELEVIGQKLSPENDMENEEQEM